MRSAELTSRAQANSRSPGFTLVELLIALTIITALGAIALQSYASYKSQAQNNQAITDLRTIDVGIQLYRQANNSYPASLTGVPQANIVDPWGNPYQYLQIEGGDVKGKGQMR